MFWIVFYCNLVVSNCNILIIIILQQIPIDFYLKLIIIVLFITKMKDYEVVVNKKINLENKDL